MVSHSPWRHPVAFESNIEKSKSVYYNLHFWLFLRHFWIFRGVVIIHWNNLKSTDVTFNVARVLGTICIVSKIFWILHLFIYREIQNWLEMNVKASTYCFQATTLLSNDLPCPRRHPVAIWTLAPRKSKSVYYNFNIGGFLGHYFWISPDMVIFSWNVHRKIEVTCNIARIFHTICIASKILWTLHSFISSEIQNCLQMNVNVSIYSFQATWLLSNDIPCP